MQHQERKDGLSRRTIVKAIGWSAPVIAAAVAVPGATASPGTPVNVGPLVESSDNIKDTTLSASSSWVTQCFPENTFSNVPFELTATVAYSGSRPDFTFEKVTLTPGTTAWRVVSRAKGQVTLRGVQNVSCQVGIIGFELSYNTPHGVVPELRSIHLDITGVSTDGTRRIGGLVSAVYGGPVIGPRQHDAPLT